MRRAALTAGLVAGVLAALGAESAMAASTASF